MRTIDPFGSEHDRVGACGLRTGPRGPHGTWRCHLVGAWRPGQQLKKRMRMGLAIVIPTKRNSVVISIAQKAAKCRNGFWKHCRKFADFQAEYEGSVPFSCIFGHPNVADAGEMDHSAVALISFVVPVATWWNPLRMSTRGDFPRWGTHRASLCLLTLSNDIFRRST